MSCDTIIKLRSGNKADIPSEVVEGELIYLTDTNEIYYGSEEEYVPIVLGVPTLYDDSNPVGFVTYKFSNSFSSDKIKATTRTRMSCLIAAMYNEEENRGPAKGELSFVGEFEVISPIDAGEVVKIGSIASTYLVIDGGYTRPSVDIYFDKITIFGESNGKIYRFVDRFSEGIEFEEGLPVGKYVFICIGLPIVVR